MEIYVESLEQLDLSWVTSLTFGCDFNQPVENLDLKGVTSLRFGEKFNQPVESSSWRGYPETVCCKQRICLWCFQKLLKVDNRCPNCRRTEIELLDF